MKERQKVRERENEREKQSRKAIRAARGRKGQDGKERDPGQGAQPQSPGRRAGGQDGREPAPSRQENWGGGEATNGHAPPVKVWLAPRCFRANAQSVQIQALSYKPAFSPASWAAEGPGPPATG